MKKIINYLKGLATINPFGTPIKIDIASDKDAIRNDWKKIIKW